MTEEDINNINEIISGKIAKSITMKKSYYDKIYFSSFVLKTHDKSKDGYFQKFDGIPVYIDDNIDKDFEFNY